jgi:hypothetical protein
MSQGMDWHRMFGLMLMDFFTGSPFKVEMEKDLSLKRQRLDVVILRKRKGQFTEQLPDGLDNLIDHNLITFKSFQEALDDWALKELTGHYVNYRKQLAERGQPLLPERLFRLYAVCSRFPHNLAQEIPWETLRPGVYECRRGTDRIRVVVTGELPQTENNALLLLFSASVSQWRFGTEHYRQHSADTSSFIFQLFQGYRKEGINMPYTIEDFRRDFIKEHFEELTRDFIKEHFEELTRDFIKEHFMELMEHFKELTPEEQREAMRNLTPQELLTALSSEQLQQLRQLLNAEPKTQQPKKRRRK